MVQLWRGVVQVMEEQVHPLVVTIPRFIQMDMPLPSLKSMVQSRRGVTQVMEVQVHPPKLLEQVKIAQSTPRTDCLAHQHE
jgi:hypothetical protein